MIPILLPRLPWATRPVASWYPNIFALALVDLDQRYCCVLCEKQWSVPVLRLSALSNWDYTRELEKTFDQHVLCQVDLVERWSALGELLG